MSIMRAALAPCLIAMCMSGCMTAQTYEGPRLARDEIAHVSGDLRVTAGAPVTVVLRRVDEQVLSLGQSAVDVLPGKHTLLVDCRIQETGSVSRFSLEEELVGGRSYKLVAETGPGLRECTAVYLQASD